MINIGWIINHKKELWLVFIDSTTAISSLTIVSHFLNNPINVIFSCWLRQSVFNICDFNLCNYFDSNLLFSSRLNTLPPSSTTILLSKQFYIRDYHWLWIPPLFCIRFCFSSHSTSIISYLLGVNLLDSVWTIKFWLYYSSYIILISFSLFID